MSLASASLSSRSTLSVLRLPTFDGSRPSSIASCFASRLSSALSLSLAASVVLLAMSMCLEPNRSFRSAMSFDADSASPSSSSFFAALSSAFACVRLTPLTTLSL